MKDRLETLAPVILILMLLAGTALVLFSDRGKTSAISGRFDFEEEKYDYIVLTHKKKGVATNRVVVVFHPQENPNIGVSSDTAGNMLLLYKDEQFVLEKNTAFFVFSFSGDVKLEKLPFLETEENFLVEVSRWNITLEISKTDDSVLVLHKLPEAPPETDPEDPGTPHEDSENQPTPEKSEAVEVS